MQHSRVRQSRCRSLPASANVVGCQTPWKAVRNRLDACGILRAGSTVRTLKAPSSRALLGGRCGGRPPTAMRLGRRSFWPSGHRPKRSTRAMVVQSNHVRIVRFAWSFLVETSEVALGSGELSEQHRWVSDVWVDVSLEEHSQGGPMGTASRLKSLAGWWSL